MPKYTQWTGPEGLLKIRTWAEDGLSDMQIASNMGVSRKTLYEWKGKYPEFAEALDVGKASAVEQVENALFKKCLGYNAEVVRTFKLREIKYDKQGKRISEKEKLVQGVDQVHIPADTQAQKFYLTNKAPEDWKNNVSFDGTVSGGIEEYLKKLDGKEQENESA